MDSAVFLCSVANTNKHCNLNVDSTHCSQIDFQNEADTLPKMRNESHATMNLIFMIINLAPICF